MGRIEYRKMNELPNFSINKFSEILSLFVQTNNKINLTKEKFLEILRGPLNKIKKLIHEILSEVNDKIFKNLRDLKSIEEENRSHTDHLFLVILIKSLTCIHENFILFYNLIYEEFYKKVEWEKEDLDSKDIKQFLELPKFLSNEINKNIQAAIDRNLGEEMNNLKIEDFMRNYNEMKDICENYLREFNLSKVDIFSKYESGKIHKIFQ